MALADPTIYSQIRPFTMSDPIENAAKLYTLQNAQLGIEKTQRALRAEDDVKRAVMSAGGDPEVASANLMNVGRVTEALGMRKSLREEQKADLERKIQQAKLSGNAAMGLDAQFQTLLRQNGGNRDAAVAAMQPIWERTAADLGYKQPGAFDPDANMAHIGGAERAGAYLTSLLPHFNAPTAAVGADGKPVLVQTDQRGGPARTVSGFAPPVPGTELSKLIAARDALPADHPDRKLYDEAIKNETSANRSKSTNVTVNTPGPMVPGKTAANKVDEEVLDTTRNLARLSTIEGMFKPHFQTIGTRAGMTWSAIKEKAGVGLTTKESADLKEFSAYKRNAIDSLNRYIKDITGAAMTNAEAERILKGLPNPGSGLFDGDSPTEFKAKLDDAMKQTKLSVARASYLKRRGMSLDRGDGTAVVQLDQMPKLMNARGREIEAKIQQDTPDVDPARLKQLVRSRLAVEFGLAND